MIWGASANSRTFWGKDARERLGWAPQDSADAFAGQLAGKVSGNPVIERYQGGAYCANEVPREPSLRLWTPLGTDTSLANRPRGRDRALYPGLHYDIQCHIWIGQTLMVSVSRNEARVVFRAFP